MFIRPMIQNRDRYVYIMICTFVVNKISLFGIMGGISINSGYYYQEGERFKMSDTFAFYIVFQKPARVNEELSKSK